MTLQLFSILSIAAIALNMVFVLRGQVYHHFIYAGYSAYIAVLMFRHIKHEKIYRKVLWWIVIALCSTSIWYLVKGLFPQNAMVEQSLHLASIPYAVINFILVMAFLSYFLLSMQRMNVMRLRSNVVFGLLILATSFVQVFINQRIAIDLSVQDIISIIFLAITSAFIIIRAISLIISAKWTNINKNSLVFILGFFCFALSNLVLVFNFDHLLMAQLPLQYFVAKQIGFAMMGFAVLNARKKGLTLAFVKIAENRVTPAFNLFWIVIFLSLLLLLTDSISAVDFTIQLVIIITYQFVDYYYNKSNSIDKLRIIEADNMLKLQSKLDERIKELTYANKQLDIRVNQDALTGLKNRYYLNTKLDELLKVQPETFTFMYLDLDNFKIINDIQGHSIGDAVLQEVAKRLMTFDDAKTDICRIGGDEFILLTPEADEQTLSELASGVTASIVKPIVVEGMEFNVGASIGIATIPTSVRRFKDLLRSAEIAMYIAKQSDSSNRTVFYQSSKSETIKRSNILSLSLNSNKLFRELKLIYQPIVQLSDNRMLAVEASIRWNHTELGTVETDEFLNMVDQTDKTEKVMKWFITTSIEEVGRWQVNYENRLKLHLKLSVQTLSIVSLTDIILSALKEYHLRPADLCIDIKESEIIKSYAMIKETLADLKKIGVEIAISEFGSGKTAFHILRMLAFDYIKFAHIFVEYIDQNERDIAILEAIIDLSKNLGRVPIVPYIEHKGQLSAIKQLGVPLASGNYLKHALGSDDFVTYYLEPLKNLNK